VNGTETWYLWESSNLLGEYSAAGAREKRYAYLGTDDRATQVEDANGVYYVHGDTSGQPRILTNGTGQVVWSARYQGFGAAVVDADPDGNSVPITLNLRFTGQYFDAESGLHYNHFRMYDPATGRYAESDLIGQHGGINTYLYAMANPLSNIDPFGLETMPNSGKPGSYPNCIKWPNFPSKDCDCADKCALEVLKFTRGCLKDCKWRALLPGGQQAMMMICSEASREWSRQCSDHCQ
jgi:RHS repeat-associated protein